MTIFFGTDQIIITKTLLHRATEIVYVTNVCHGSSRTWLLTANFIWPIELSMKCLRSLHCIKNFLVRIELASSISFLSFFKKYSVN